MQTLAEVVEAAMRSLDVKPTDAGTAALALTYARRIDEGDDLTRLGPALLSTLDALLMTPKARAAVMKGAGDVPKPVNPVDDLRARREQRRAG